MNIVFFGSSGFAVPSLEAILDQGWKVLAVVTAPDRLGGRGKKQVISTPVKDFAKERGLTILQPKNLKSKSFNTQLKSLNPELQVVVAFRMLPERVWSLPSNGTFNLHGSLLPKYRGAAPINWAVTNGEEETGCTTFFIDEKIDTGLVIDQVKTKIQKDETAGELHDRLMILGAGLVVQTIHNIISGTVELKKQIEEEVSHAPKLYKEDGRVDFEKNTRDIYNFIRGMTPYPGAWLDFGKKTMTIIRSKMYLDGYHNASPGSVMVVDQRLFLFTKDGIIEVLELKYSGKRQMLTKEFLNGFDVKKELD